MIAPTMASAWVAGTMVTPSVRLVRELGAGGMGSVWVADHLTLQTQVVVKFITQALSSDPGTVARFSREAAAASKVKSPHVVQMFDHGVADGGVPFIVMELLEGEDLSHRLERVQVMPAHEVADVVSQVCKALSRAHEKGIVHRDIKPQNIFLCDVGSADVFVKLLDFGIAKGGEAETMATTRTGAALGTPYYMSPEQAIGSKAIDHRTDLWSLGVVAVEAMTGQRPFNGETIGALALAIHHGALPVPSRLNPALPKEVDAWFERACARDVQARFQSARELGDALLRAVGVPVRTSTGDHAGAYAAAIARDASPLARTQLDDSGASRAPTSKTTGTGATQPAPPLDKASMPSIPKAPKLPAQTSTDAPSSVTKVSAPLVAPSPRGGPLLYLAFGAVGVAVVAVVVAIVAVRGRSDSTPTPTNARERAEATMTASAPSMKIEPAKPPSTSEPVVTTSAPATSAMPTPTVKKPAPTKPTPTASAPKPKPKATSDDEILK